MAFDYDAFEAAQASFPTKEIPVPTLKDFFPEGETPIWKIKCLTGLELAIVEDAAANNLFERKKAAIEACAGNSIQQMKAGYEELLNSGENITPAVYIRWLKLVELGSVPPCPEHICVKLAQVQGSMLRLIAHEVALLSAMGADLGK